MRAAAVRSLEDIRADLRAGDSSVSEPTSMGSAILTTLAAIFATCVGAWLVHFLFLKPVAVPLQPSAALPTFAEVQAELKRGSAQPEFILPAGESRMPRSEPDYAGKTPIQIGKAADDVCFARAQARYPHWSRTPRLTTKQVSDFFKDEMPHFNELMHCLLTEASIRYCSTSQRRMLVAEITMYFRGIEFRNKDLTAFRSRLASEGNYSNLEVLHDAEITADDRVISAVEMRLRDGLLKTSDREQFSAAAPPAIRQRFANIKPATPPCPVEPWWALWR
jgi:hypothetical protein